MGGHSPVAVRLKEFGRTGGQGVHGNEDAWGAANEQANQCFAKNISFAFRFRSWVELFMD